MEKNLFLALYTNMKYATLQYPHKELKIKQEATHQWISLLHDYSINSISDR